MQNKYLTYFIFIILLSSFVSAGAVGFSNVKIQSDYPGLNAPDGIWVFEWTDDGFTTDRVRASFSPSNLQSETGTQSKQNFYVDIDGTKNSCQYDIMREANRLDIFTVDIIQSEKDFYSWEYDVAGLQAQAVLLANQIGCLKMDDYPDGIPGSFELDSGIITDDIRVTCFKQKSVLGKVGSIRNLKYITETQFATRVDGKATYSDTVSNSETGSGRTTKLGEDVYIQWQGLLGSGETCPISTEELMAYSSSFSGNWKVIDRSSYNVYESFMRNSLDELAVNYINGLYSESSVESIVNSKSSSAIRERLFSNFNVNIIDQSLTNGRLQIDLDRQIKFPRFRLFVDSDYLELVIPTGKPDIQCPYGTINFQEGEPGKITLTAKNVGSNTGGFNIRIKNCDLGFSSGDTEGITLSAGESRQITLQTSAEVQGDKQSGQCTIEMKESATQETDICTVSLSATKPAECTEGNKWCGYDYGQNVIKECISGNEKIIEKCPQLCLYDDSGQPYCGTGEDGETPVVCKPYLGFIPNLSSECLGLSDSIKLVVSILGTLISFGVGYSWLKKKYKSKKDRPIALILSLLIALFLGILIYLVFWIGVIIFVVYLLVRFAIKMFT